MHEFCAAAAALWLFYFLLWDLLLCSAFPTVTLPILVTKMAHAMRTSKFWRCAMPFKSFSVSKGINVGILMASTLLLQHP